MEHHVNAIEDHLIEGLSFKMPPGSSYVTERRNTTFFPSGGNQYSTTGVRVIRFNLTGTDAWLDPTTVKIAMDVVNTDGTPARLLRPLVGGHGFFSRARVYAGGALLEDIFDWGRFSQMFNLLQPHRKRINDFIEGFGGEKPFIPAAVAGGVVTPSQLSTPTDADTIAGGGRKTVMFSPALGIFIQNKFLPLRYVNIQLELELCVNQLDPISGVGAAVAADAAGNHAGVAAAVNAAGDTSALWQLENVRLMADTITLDSELENQFAEHLLSGKSMPIKFSSWTTNIQTTGGNAQPTLNISRSLTRLKDIYVSFYQTGNILDVANSPLKNVNYFKCPSLVGGDFLEFQLVIGNKVFPDFPLKSIPEYWNSFKKALGIQDSSFYDIDVNTTQYGKTRFFIGQNLEKIINSSFTGQNTKAGDLVTLRFKNLADITHVVTTLHYDVLLNIRQIGCEVMD